MLTGFHSAQAEVQHERGLRLFQQGEVDAAIEALGLALLIQPDYVLAQQNLKLALGRKIHDCGMAQSGVEPVEENIDALAAAVCQAQQDPLVWEALSYGYYQKKNYAAAEICLQNAALTNTNLPENQRARVFLNLAIIALDLRKLDAARCYAWEAMRNDPANPEIPRTFAKAHSNFLSDITYDPYSDRETIFQHHQAWGTDHHLPGKLLSHKTRKSRRKKLRLGLVSADFYSHPVGIFLFSILECLNQARFEVYCYAEVRVDDRLTQSIQSKVTKWLNISGMDDVQLAHRIHDDAVDVLMDLSGHTGGNRLRAFTLKPAPKQVSFIGYWDTTGVAEMDYVITDAYTVPPGDERYFTERVVRMPVSRFCYRPPAFAPEITLKPEQDHIVFSCFNNDKKLNDDVIARWAEILEAVPDSLLFLKWKTYADAARVASLKAQFARFGIDAGRLLIEGADTYDVLLDLYNRVDIALDPFPFTGGLTTCDALWMGVPVVTWAADRPVGRQSAAILNTIGASELIAATPADYVELAKTLAQDRVRLLQYKKQLRIKLIQSPLVDAAGYTRAFELTLQNIAKGKL